VTLRGKCHAHNVGCSLLTTLGLTDWIAEEPDEYVAIAARMAADLPALARCEPLARWNTNSRRETVRDTVGGTVRETQ
jgi:protein O-GlcNAc transferase